MVVMLVGMSEPGGQPCGAVDRLRRLEHVTDTALAYVEPGDLVRELLERVRELIDADAAVALIHDTDAGVLVPTAASGRGYDVREAIPVPVGQGFAGSVAVQKRPIVLDRVDETTVVNPQLWTQGVQSMLGVPLLAAGRVVGVLHVDSVTPRRFTEDDVHLLQVTADRMALAVQADTSRSEHAAAMALQRSLLPAQLPSVPGVALAARYLPGGESGVSGDWYDVFTLPSHRVGVVIGDVVSHGLRAAVIMGRMRSALRAYALETEDPAVVLEKLDRETGHFEPGVMATVGFAIYDPSTHHLEMSLAGHPPPVYAGSERPATLFDGPVDLPIGARLATRRRRTSRLQVAPAGVVCFYTDGLVERRNTSVDDGLNRLCGAVEAGSSADDVTAAIMEKLLTARNPSDDVALVVLCRTNGDQTAGQE